VRIGVALKLVPGRPEVDPLSGAVTTDDRRAGPSDADRAALEWALRLADAWGPSTGAVEVVAVTAGPPVAERVLREALAAGATRGLRIDVPAGAASTVVARALAEVFTALGCGVVCCGDYSPDRGSGSVPALIADATGHAQALGLVSIDVGAPGHLEALRRLDGGRRERLRLVAPVVVSVEGSSARLRRAGLAASLRAGDATVEVVEAEGGVLAAARRHPPAALRPYRPRARTLPAPTAADPLQRVLQLTAATAPRTPPRTVVADPAEAARVVLDQLREWGELEP